VFPGCAGGRISARLQVQPGQVLYIAGGSVGGTGEPVNTTYPVAGLPGADGVLGSGGKGADDQLSWIRSRQAVL